MLESLVVRPITPSRFSDVETLFKTDSTMRSCWDIWPRYAGKEHAEIEARHHTKRYSEANRLELRRLAGRRRAPGLLAYDGRDAVGFLSLGPRTEMRRTDASRATPRVDLVPVWVVLCFFVRKGWVPRYTMRAECS